MEKLVKLAFPPGVFRNGTAYQAEGRWYGSNLIRWVDGALEPIGGWVLQTDSTGAQIQTSGKPRASHSWRKNDGSAWLGVGTPTKLYAFAASTLTLSDITPAGLVTGITDGIDTGGGLGYGLGGYGVSPYGGLGGSSVIDADTWSLDNFGEVLLAVLTSDGKVYESTPTAQAVQVTNSPSGVRAVVVTPERFVMALGGTSAPRLVQWSSQEARTVWAPAAGNSAGSFTIQTNGRLICGERTARETLIWTDADLWAAVYIGGKFIYSFQQRGDNCGIIGPNAQAINGGVAYWMGDGQFFRYDGAVQALPCEVSDYVFSDLNRTQRAKICTIPLSKTGEIMWFYPSASQSGLENDRYVKLNPRLGAWDIGLLNRATGSGAEVFSQPMLWDTGGVLYAHEIGQNRGGLVAYIESGPMEIGDGDTVTRVQSLICDELTLGDVTAQFFASFQPNGTETSYGPYQIDSKTDVRFTARQARVRFAENNIISGVTMDSTLVTMDSSMTLDTAAGGGVGWRLGIPRLGVIQGGRR